MVNEIKNPNNSEDGQLILKIIEAIKSIKYGTIQITVHNAKVTQIDKIERIRVTKDETV